MFRPQWLPAEIAGELDHHPFMDFELRPLFSDFNRQAWMICNHAVDTLADQGRHADRVINSPGHDFPALSVYTFRSNVCLQ